MIEETIIPATPILMPPRRGRPTLSGFLAPLILSAAAVLDGRIHVLGGSGQAREATTTHLVFDLAEDRWYRAPDLPMATEAAEVVAANGAVWVLGGWNADMSPPLRQEVWVFRPGS